MRLRLQGSVENATPEHTVQMMNGGNTVSATEKQREALAKNMIKVRANVIHGGGSDSTDLAKAGVPGVTTALGIVFYDLRPLVELLYPVNVPIRNSLARVSRVNDGWGTAAHWMATRTVGSQPIEAEEGKRVGIVSR